MLVLKIDVSNITAVSNITVYHILLLYSMEAGWLFQL